MKNRLCESFLYAHIENCIVIVEMGSVFIWKLDSVFNHRRVAPEGGAFQLLEPVTGTKRGCFPTIRIGSLEIAPRYTRPPD